MEKASDKAAKASAPAATNVAAALLGLQLGVVGALLFLADEGIVPNVAGLALIAVGLAVGVAAASG